MPEEARIRAVEIQLARNAEVLDNLEHESGRMRERLHKIEASIAGLAHLPSLVRAELDRYERERSEQLRGISQVRAQWLAVGVALGGVIVALTGVVVTLLTR